MENQSGPRRGKGTVYVSRNICKGCSYCIDFCPTRCLEFSKELNPKGYHFPVLARPEDCTGCGMCANYCPDFAIHAVRFADLAKAEAEAAEKERGT